MAKKSTQLFTGAAVIILLLVTGGGLYAWPNLIVSPQREATATEFWSNPDFFMSTTGYGAIDFDKWFGTVSFLGNHSDYRQTSMAQLGFATRFGDVYTGFYYGGNTWYLQPHLYTERKTGGTFFGSDKTMKTYLTLPTISAIYTLRNEAAVLIGIADMGFRLSFVSTYRSRILKEDFAVGGDYYRSFHDEYGSINPEIAWGMAKELIPGKGIKPHVYIDVDIFRDNRNYERYMGATSATEPDTTIVKSNDSLNLGLVASSGTYSLVQQNGFDFGLDLWYTLGITTYNNQYNYTDGTEIKVGKNYKGKYSTGGVFAEESSNSHWLTPYLYAAWEGDKLALSAELGLGLGLAGQKNSEMNFSTSGAAGTLVKNGTEYSLLTFALAPDLYLGMKWDIVSDKLSLNVGATISFGQPEWTTVNTVDYDQGKEDADSAGKIVNNEYYGASTILSLGFSFSPTTNVEIQAMCGVDTDNSVGVFNPTSTGLATFSKILVSLKF